MLRSKFIWYKSILEKLTLISDLSSLDAVKLSLSCYAQDGKMNVNKNTII